MHDSHRRKPENKNKNQQQEMLQPHRQESESNMPEHVRSNEGLNAERNY